MLHGMWGAHVNFVAKTRDPVPTTTGISLMPNFSFDECPKNLDLLLVPGGYHGTLASIEDRPTLDFVRDRGGRAKVAGAVCTGSLLLGAAGLLDGHRATSHWLTLDLLTACGATPVKQRVVFDRDRVTGAGVTAGLDFGLELVRRYRGDLRAETVQQVVPTFRRSAIGRVFGTRAA